MPPRGRAGLLLPVRRARLGDPGEGQQPRPGPLDVRQRRQPRRRLRQRPAAVLGGGRRHRGRAALPRVDRQPAQVLPDRPPGLAAQADHRGAVRAAPPRACRWATPSARSRRRRQAVDAMFRQAGRDPGRHAGGDVRRRPAARPPAAAARAPGRDRRQLRRARPARRRRGRRGRPGRQQVGRARAPRRPPRTSRTPSTRPSTTPRSTRSSRSTSRRSTSPARTSPTCWPRSASSPTSRWSPRSSAPRACPSCCGSPTSPAPRPAAARCRRTPRVEAAVRALARVVEYAVWLRTPDGAADRRPSDVDPAAAKRLVSEVLAEARRRHRPRPGRS